MKYYRLVFSFILLSFIFLASPVRAATFLLDAPETVLVGDTVEVVLYLDTENDNVNSLGSLLLFPQGLFKFNSINDGDSIVSLWVEKPRLIGDGVISFAGIIPGGFTGLLSTEYQGVKPGKVLTASFEVLDVGQGEFKLQETKLLRHDGLGTAIPVDLERVGVETRQADGQIREPSDKLDIDAPESFAISLAQSPDIFSNQWFIAFATHDKGSGIDYYQVQETSNSTPDGTWISGESPYLLTDQKLRSNIFVKAIDKQGNERLQVLPATNSKTWWKLNSIWGIIVLLIAFLIVSIWRKWSLKTNLN